MANKQPEGLGDNIWILIPLAALSIPIFAVVGADSPLTYAIAGVIALVAVTLAVRFLMTHRHRLKMEELEARERIVRAEREHLSAAERILDMDDGRVDIDEAIRRTNDPQAD